MPEEASDQAERLLGGPEAESPLPRWKTAAGEDHSQGPTVRRHTRWQSCCRLFAPVLTVLTALVVVSSLFILLDPSALDRLRRPPSSAGGPATPERDLMSLLHPEDHIGRDAKVIRLSWTITKARLAPDGVHRDVVLINGQFPGPTVEARTGDTLVIEVRNAMDEGVSLHWHGLHMRGANHMDGPVGVNQCAIPPGGTFVYEVPTADQSGTFWYHAHSELQRADGFYGGLVIHNPAEAESVVHQYDKELLFLIGDWYHFSGKEIFAVFEDPTSNGNEPCPESVLINGLGTYDCSLAAPAAPVDCAVVAEPWIVLDKTLRYRFRIVNVGSLTGISTIIPDATMKAIQVDGGLPVVAHEANSIGVVYPAQRVDYILSWPDAAAHTDTELVVIVDGEYYVGNRLNPPSRSVRIASSTPDRSIRRRATKDALLDGLSSDIVAFDLREARAPPLAAPLPEPDSLYMIFAVVEILSHNGFVPKGYINHTFWIPQDRPMLSVDRGAWDTHQFVPWTGSEPVWVELTINNIDTQGHPFHLHGFDFYVVGSHEGLGGWDYYNPFFTPWKPPRGGPVNVLDPLKRDTIYVPPYGYVILRFRADNEGLWVLHCHILWHQASGMNMAFQVLGSEHGLSESPAGRSAAEYCKAIA